MKTNLQSKLPLKNLSNPFLEVPPKAPRVGDVGWMVDCKGAELTKFAHLGQNRATIPFPVGLVRHGSYTWKNILLDYD